MLKGKDLQRAEFLLYSENVRKLTEIAAVIINIRNPNMGFCGRG